jgi:hypothetical protein
MKTAVVDDRHRIRIPNLKPGQILAYEDRDGIVTLTPVKPVEPPPAKYKLVKKGRFTVIETDRQISLETINELLAEFP